ALPLLFTLHGNSPNPFNASTVLRYELAQTAEVDLAVYNLIGQRVRTLVLGRVGAGLYQVPWDGVDGQGKAVASGLYFARLYADGQEMIGKMLLLR
ncbi:MAG: flagellar hook assembly protein FlgD, partial [Planctomycetota bacterium]